VERSFRHSRPDVRAADHLAHRVHTAIGASGEFGCGFAASEPCERLIQFLLNGSHARLPLRPPKPGSVVPDGEFEHR
jgi:hypothetical protein